MAKETPILLVIIKVNLAHAHFWQNETLVDTETRGQQVLDVSLTAA